MSNSPSTVSFFWRTTAIILTLVFTGMLFSGLGIGFFMVVAIIAAIILNVGLRDLGGIRLFGNIILLALVITSGAVTGAFLELFPRTGKMIERAPENIDSKIAIDMLEPGEYRVGRQFDQSLFTDSLTRIKYDSANNALLQRVRAERGWTAITKRLKDSLDASELREIQTAKRLQEGRPLTGADTTLPKQSTPPAPIEVSYDIRNRAQVVADVPAFHSAILTASTSGYICDPKLGLIPSADGGTYLAAMTYAGNRFIAPGQPIFCILGQLGNEAEIAFRNNTCILYNNTPDSRRCVVKVNERDCGDCWDDNVGEVTIKCIFRPLGQ